MRPLVTHNKYYWAYPHSGEKGVWHIRRMQHSKMGVLCGIYSRTLVGREGDESKPYCDKCYRLYLMELMA